MLFRSNHLQAILLRVPRSHEARAATTGEVAHLAVAPLVVAAVAVALVDGS